MVKLTIVYITHYPLSYFLAQYPNRYHKSPRGGPFEINLKNVRRAPPFVSLLPLRGMN